jgi:hypothetical protein
MSIAGGIVAREGLAIRGREPASARVFAEHDPLEQNGCRMSALERICDEICSF